MEAKSEASDPVSQMNSAFTEIVTSAISWLAKGSEDRKPIHVGRRKLAYLLIGSSNGTALKLQFFKCPYWGSLSFLSVRKVERLIRDRYIEEILGALQNLSTDSYPQILQMSNLPESVRGFESLKLKSADEFLKRLNEVSEAIK